MRAVAVHTVLAMAVLVREEVMGATSRKVVVVAEVPATTIKVRANIVVHLRFCPISIVTFCIAIVPVPSCWMLLKRRTWQRPCLGVACLHILIGREGRQCWLTV